MQGNAQSVGEGVAGALKDFLSFTYFPGSEYNDATPADRGQLINLWSSHWSGWISLSTVIISCLNQSIICSCKYPCCSWSFCLDIQDFSQHPGRKRWVSCWLLQVHREFCDQGHWRGYIGSLSFPNRHIF